MSSKKSIALDELTEKDLLLVWSFFDGGYATVPAAQVFAHTEDYNTIVKLIFSDGTIIKVVNEHKFMSVNDNAFVSISAGNVQDHIGKSFVKMSDGGLTSVELIDCEIYEEYGVAWAAVSSYHYNIFVEGMLSIDMRDAFIGAFCYFDIGEDMAFDQAAIERDVETYGLYTYADFEEYLTVEQFELLNVKYMKIAVGKGLVTFDDLLTMIDLFL